MSSSFLDHLETILCNAHQWSLSHRRAVRACLGAALLFHGNELLGTVLILQGVRVTGTELMDRSLNDLYETYKRTRAAIKENMPTLSEIADLERKLNAAANDLKGGKITPQNYEKISKDMKDLQQSIQRSQSFIHSVVAAVNPQHLGDIMKGLHMYLLSVSAVATSTTAATITVGLNIGQTISERTYSVLYQRNLNDASTSSNATSSSSQNDSVSAEEWVKAGVQFIGNSIGLSISYFMQKTSLMFGAAMMGSEFMITAFEDLIDPYMERAKLPTLKANHAAKVVIQSSLVAVGFLSQIRGGQTYGLKIIMYPLYLSEAIVQTYIFSRIVKKDHV